MEGRAWWRRYFGDDFYQLHVDLFSEEQSRHEVAAIAELLGLPVGSRILDVPCGWGRHTALLAEAGFEAFGADLSPALISHRSLTSEPAYCAADLRQLPFAAGSFDGAINVFTSLGLFLNDNDDIAALAEIRRVLRPGGVFLLESMHRDDVIADYAERDSWTLPDGTEVQVRRRFDPITGISHERLRWRRGTQRGEKRHALKLRTATEIDALLHGAGFDVVDYFGDWDRSTLTHRSEHVIAVAQRGQSAQTQPLA